MKDFGSWLQEWLMGYHTAWTIGLIIFALSFALFVMFLVWVSTELRLMKATRTETIIDHRHSTPTTVDFVITNPLKMRFYQGSFFDPYEFSLHYGKDRKKFKMEYVGRLGNNYKFRIFDLKPATVYTDVRICMGGKKFFHQPVVNIWTRDVEDRIIAISEATPIDPEIEVVNFKAKNRHQRRINETYFKYAVHYGNSKTRWIDVQSKPFSENEIKSASELAKNNSETNSKTKAKATVKKTATTKKTVAKKASANKSTTTKAKK